MALTATFKADFTSFYDAVNKAEIELKSFSTEAGKVEKSLTSMANSLSGQRMIQQATLMATAVEKIGGVSKLTEKELQSLGNQAKEAVEKMNKLGIGVPDNLQKIANAAKPVGEGLSGILGIAGKLAGAFGIAFGVGQIASFAKEAFTAAARLEELAKATGISAEGLQRLQYVSAGFGLDLETISHGVENFSTRLATGDKSAARAVESLGLNVKALIASGPQEAFLQFAEAAGRVSDPMEKAGIASQAFGEKLARQLIPALGDLRQKMLDVPKDAIISDEQIKNAQDFDEALLHLEQRAKGAIVRTGDLVLEILKAYKQVLTPETEEEIQKRLGATGFFNTPKGGTLTPGGTDPATTALIDHATLLKNKIDALRAQAMQPLTEDTKRLILELQKWGESESEIAIDVGKSEAAVHRFLDTNRDAKQKAEEYRKENERVIQKLHELQSLLPGLSHGLDGIFSDHAIEDAKKYNEEVEKVNQKILELSRVGLPYFLDGLDKIGTKTDDIEKLQQHFKDVNEEATKSAQRLTALAGAFAQLAQISGGSFGGLIKGVGEFVGTLAVAETALAKLAIDTEKFGKNSVAAWTDAISAATAYIALVQLGGAAIAAVLGNERDHFKDVLDQIDAQKSRLQQLLELAGKAQGRIPQAIGVTIPQQAELERASSTFLNSTDIHEQARAWVEIQNIIGSTSTKVAVLTKEFDLLAKGELRASDVADDLTSALQEAGRKGPEALRAMVDELEKMPGLTDAERAALERLTQKARPDFEKLKQDAAGLGISLAALGPKFEQGSLEDRVLSFADTFQQLIDAGADFGGALFGAKDQFQKLISESEEFGTAIPDVMKPWIEELIKARLLTDKAGNVLTDVSDITFEGTPLDKGLADLNDAIEHLVEVLTKDLPDALKNLPSPDPIHVPVIYDVVNRPNLFGATGGEVTSSGIQHFAGGGNVLPFAPRGTDTVPAMLTPGELVLTRDQQRLVGRLLSFGSASSRLGSGGGAGFSPQLEAVKQAITQLDRNQAARDRRMPHLISLAVRDIAARR